MYALKIDHWPMTTGANIRRIRKAKGLTILQLANASDSDVGNISRLERDIQGYSKELLERIATALGVRVSDLFDEESNVEPGPDMRGLVPLISWVTAGNWNPAADPLQPGEAEDWLPLPKKNGKHTYALRVRGDSMTSPHGKTYPDGCIIFVDPERRSPSTGDRIIAKLEGTDEVTFKQFVSDAGRVWLKPLNPQYPLITEEFKVLGTIIGKWEDE